ncbi:probable RNA-binding protein 19 isoform X2 [Hydra vulgaris]|uniref:Probable RNA-binding protein 19 isoform X2 n=1 Tax=Hydra vulgaris TaxID=6087 RepID=A0ABM4CP45_HYDVU
MSRLIVKNLPKDVKKESVKELFESQGGEITDLKLCFTKEGTFRKFAFVGYKTDTEALAALKFLNNTFMGTSKIHLEICKDLGDPSVPRPWSKYSKGSSSFSRKAHEIEERKNYIKELQFGKSNESKLKKELKEKSKNEFKDLENNSEFQDFVGVHLNKGIKQSWTNDNINYIKTKTEKISKRKKEKNDIKENINVNFNDEDNEIEAEKVNEDWNKKEAVTSCKVETAYNIEQNNKKENVAKIKDKTSDLEWLKIKTLQSKGESTESDEKTEETADRDLNSDVKENSDDLQENVTKKTFDQDIKSMTVKMRGIPFKCSEKEVIKFFKPLVIDDIRFPKNKDGKSSGYAFVDFKTIEDVKSALKKDKQKIQGRYIELFPVNDLENLKQNDFTKKWTQKGDEADEDISDTGRLFVRNLSYACTEDSLTNLFSQFGPLIEINLPIDKNSNKTTGFAFVTFMLADHAIKAMSKLDGSIFEGRILHILPGKSKKVKEEDNTQSSSYKIKQEAKKKLQTHNWNALFLGQNAVVDVMANRLNKSKHDILDTESSSSLAVRMALGETELVSETREFLESEGVKLDCFGQANSLRSKTVILVKNLPPQTLTSELREIFSKYGDLGRLLMPPFGITAIVEFIQSKDAKNAFNNLAYSKFKHTPLYLEWAPLDVLSGEVKNVVEKKVEDVESEDEINDAQAVLFVKNLNFNTAEERFKEFFSSCGEIKSVTIAKKQDPKNPSAMLSMGYGFIEYKKIESVEKALKLLQYCELDGHKVELKKSHRESILPKVSRKRANEKNQVSSKMVVRNIPFEATVKELQELFSTFGHIKSLRLPKKITGAHRGFAFIDFTTKQDAKRAFKALCQSTHLYGRRLVLEWADDDDSVDLLRKKTAELYHESSEPSAKKSKMSLQSALEKTKISSDSL